MAAFPLHPRYSRLLLAADEVGGVPKACLLAAITQQRDLMLPLNDRRAREEREDLLGETESDLFHRLTLFGMARKKAFAMGFCKRWGIHAGAARMADRTAGQLLRQAAQQGLDTETNTASESDLRRCLLVAFADHLAKRDRAGTLRCSLVHGRRGELRNTSAIKHANLFVAAEIDEIETRGEATVYLNLATAVEEAWLDELFAGEVQAINEAAYDVANKRVINRKQRAFRGLVLTSGESGLPNEDDAARLLAEEVRRGHLELKQWDDRVDRWLQRLNFAAKHCPELEIEPLDEAGRQLIIEQAVAGCLSAKDVRNADVWPHVKSWLSREQRAALDHLVPESFKLPRRNKATAIRYEDDRAILASKLQDFYDADPKSLVVCGGRVPLTLELLAPNGRPAQTTTDLAGFWENSYPAVRKELKGRYPKHEWR
ncbi:MAG: ATP-dependent helicase C-terminal domain-containing protein [Opitutales bacterium]